MFKKLVLGFLLLPVFCLPYTERVYQQIEEAWDLDRKGNYFGAVNILNSQLIDSNIADVDRMHLLIARSMFWISLNRQDLWLEDQNAILDIRKSCQECESEFRIYYD